MWHEKWQPLYAPEGAGAGAGAGGEGGGGDAGGSSGGGGSQATPWHQGLDAETIGHIQNRGLKLDDPKIIVDNLAKAHREAASKLGVPPDQLVRALRPDSQPAEIKAFWKRFGAPDDAKGYDLSAVKYADGTDLEPALVDVLRNSASRLNMPKEWAAELAKDLAKHVDSDKATEATERQTKIAAERADLAKSWGTNHDRFKFAAEQARIALQTALNLPNDKMAQVIGTIEQAYGYADTMKLFHLISTKIGEDKFVATGGTQGGGMSREQAVARKGELMKDQAWVDRYMKGGAAERTEMLSLNRIITGDYESAA